MAITVEEAIAKFKQNPDWRMTEEEVKAMGKEELRRFLELYIEAPEGKRAIVDFYMQAYEPYFKE